MTPTSLPKRKPRLRWQIVYSFVCNAHRAELWDQAKRKGNTIPLSTTRWVSTRAQARRDGRKVFARFEEGKD